MARTVFGLTVFVTTDEEKEAVMKALRELRDEGKDVDWDQEWDEFVHIEPQDYPTFFGFAGDKVQ